MKRTAVQFGAGNIGRGFIAQLFHESGYEVVFIDVIPEIVEALNARHEYVIRIVGKGAQDVPITDVRAVDGRERETVAAEIAACEVACTAVGAGALKRLAPNLAAGLLLRHRQGGGPLNILICENLHDAQDVLRALVAEHLPADERDEILAKTGFVQAVVSRMVPLQTPIQNPKSKIQNLDIRVEAYKRLPVDGPAIVGALPPIVGVEPVPNFEAHVERKLYTHNCAHATLGYLGWIREYTYGYEALSDSDIRFTLDKVMEETGTALIRKHGFDPTEHAAHVADLMERFTNRELGDTCFRLARDPLRKLAPDDRLVGAARLCETQQVKPLALSEVIGAAFCFDAPEDPSAVELQRRLETEGFDGVIQSLCDIKPNEPLGRRIERTYAWLLEQR
jgi:mannitol-1-phosphate 5-dehydrogenase